EPLARFRPLPAGAGRGGAGWSAPEAYGDDRPIPRPAPAGEVAALPRVRGRPYRFGIATAVRFNVFPQTDFALTRRAFLGRYAGSLGTLALAHLVGQAADSPADPLAPKKPHHEPKAKAVICLFQHGGPSQMDLFDPKPELTRQHGKPHPDKLEVHF